MSGASPTYFVPWRVSAVSVCLLGPNFDVVLASLRQDKVPLKEKLDQIMRWVDLPLDNRPQLITGMLTEYLGINVLDA